MYDGEGRVTRTVTRREVEWDDEQRAMMLAYQAHLADTCSGCGNPLSETTDRAAEGQYRAPLPTRCHACTPILSAMKTYETAQQRQALRFHAERVDPL